jgi:hypothetical protein
MDSEPAGEEPDARHMRVTLAAREARRREHANSVAVEVLRSDTDSVKRAWTAEAIVDLPAPERPGEPEDRSGGRSGHQHRRNVSTRPDSAVILPP